MPLSVYGLCEADTTAPKLAFRCAVMQATAGVGTTPQRTALTPIEFNPATRADSSISPETRVSRPTMQKGLAAPQLAPRARTLAAAWPRRMTNSGVMGWTLA